MSGCACYGLTPGVHAKPLSGVLAQAAAMYVTQLTDETEDNAEGSALARTTQHG
ncbi:hypothetical protein WI665_12040 [Vibrio cholerae]